MQYQNAMNLGDRIYVALDCAKLARAVDLGKALAPLIGGFKIGLELLSSVGAPTVVEALKPYGKRIFLDVKFKDIPRTVGRAVRAVSKLGVDICNVHALGGIPMMTAAVEAAQGSSTSVIAVTVLTSMSVDGLRAMGMKHISDEQGLRAYVVQLALAAQQAGCAGVVASPQEVVALREACGPDFMIVTPGVRPIWAQLDDQKRVATPKEALKAGADYLVIGRPLTSPPKEIGNSVAAARRLLGEMSTMQGN